MEAQNQHTILVVDGDSRVTDPIGRLLEHEKFTPVLENNGKSALQRIKTSTAPFSLIIVGQQLGEMQGTALLEKIKTLSPDSQRFLLTAYSEVATIINAVNQGSIHRYIAKPWEDETLIQAVHNSIRHFERNQETEKLLALAKKQNSNLYDLNCELMEKTTLHNRESQTLEAEIEDLKKVVRKLSEASQADPDTLLADIHQHIKKDGRTDPEQIKTLFFQTIRQLYKQFNAVAQQNGFEMPIPKGST